MHVCSLLSYNNIVIVLFAGDLHACGSYSYDSSNLGLFGLQTTHMQFLAFCTHAYVCNLTLPIRLSIQKLCQNCLQFLKPVGCWQWQETTQLQLLGSVLFLD